MKEEIERKNGKRKSKKRRKNWIKKEEIKKENDTEGGKKEDLKIEKK